MNKSHFFLPIGLCCMVLYFGCSARGNRTGREFAPQMYHTVPYDPLSQIKDSTAGNWLTSRPGKGEFYNSNPYNLHGMTMRQPVPGTVPRQHGLKAAELPYRLPKDSLALAAATLRNPLDSTQAVLDQGKILFERFCSHCHGATGKGDGLVAPVYKGVTSYTSRAVKNVPEGHLFHVITHGKGRMQAHQTQLSIEERWQIVRYVQLLQKQ